MALDIQERLLELLVRTGAIRVRTSENELPFWYTSCIPGPYYINVEKIIGASTARNALDAITEVLSKVSKSTDRVQRIWDIVVKYLHEDAQYNEVISLLVAYHHSIPHSKPSVISGGERRDWFFSIPFSLKLNLPHVFLFKSGDLTTVDVEGNHISDWDNTRVLHISDIVNTATSYARHWIPTLNKNGIELSNTFTVAVRGTQGLKELDVLGVNTITPLELSEDVFNSAHENGLINSFSLNEILQYIDSPRLWTREVLKQCGDIMLERFPKLEATQQARMRSFIQNDPYGLHEEFPFFFERVTIGL